MNGPTPAPPSRAELLEQVFGQRGDLQTRAVDMAIAVLRKKLEAYAVLLHSRPQRDLELWLVDARPAANGLEAICRSIGLSFNVRCFRLPELNQRPVAAPVPTLDGREWHCTSNDAAQPRAENTNNQRVARGRSAAAGTVAATAARTSVQVREVHAGLGGDESA